MMGLGEYAGNNVCLRRMQLPATETSSHISGMFASAVRNMYGADADSVVYVAP